MLGWLLNNTIGLVGFELGWTGKAVLVLTTIGFCTFGIGFMLNGGAHVLDEIDDLIDSSPDSVNYDSELSSDGLDDYVDSNDPTNSTNPTDLTDPTDPSNTSDFNSDIYVTESSVSSVSSVNNTLGKTFADSWGPLRDEIKEYLENECNECNECN